MLTSLYSKTSLTLHLFVLGWAFWRGGRDVRIFGAILLAGTLMTILLQNRFYPHHDMGLLLVDAVQLAALIVLGVISRQNWVVVGTSFTLLALLLHFAKWLSNGIDPFPYLTLYALCSYGVLAALIWGIFVARKSMVVRQTS